MTNQESSPPTSAIAQPTGSTGSPSAEKVTEWAQALPDEDKPGLAAALVRGITAPDQQQDAAERVVGSLRPTQRQQLAETVLGRPDKRTRQLLWYIVVCTMAATVLVFGVLAFVLIYQNKPAEAPLALATTALGGVVGLVATSPGSSSSN